MEAGVSMSSEMNFGKRLLEHRVTSEQIAKRKIRYLILGFGLIVVGAALGVYLIINRQGIIGVVLGIIPLLIFVPGILCIKAAGRDRQEMEAILYALGVRHTIGTKSTEIAFEDIKGIRDVQWHKGRGKLTRPTKREATIVKKDGTEFELHDKIVPDYEVFFDVLDVKFTEYLLRDITCEVLGQINISFGKELELRDGQFIYTQGRGGSIIAIPLDAVRQVRDRPTPRKYEAFFTLTVWNESNSNFLVLTGWDETKGRVEILAKMHLADVLNIRALRRVVEMAADTQAR